jgi:prepilin-type N-terminal cleavage/methylation domain-containing protein
MHCNDFCAPRLAAAPYERAVKSGHRPILHRSIEESKAMARTTGCSFSPKPQEPRRAGFSLVEVVGALAVLSIIALSASLLIVALAREARIHREVTVANLEAKRFLEEIQATPLNDLIDRYPDGSSRSVQQLPNGSVAVDYDDPEADPLEIHVQVSWTSPDLGDMARVFDTARTE